MTKIQKTKQYVSIYEGKENEEVAQADLIALRHIESEIEQIEAKFRIQNGKGKELRSKLEKMNVRVPR